MAVTEAVGGGGNSALGCVWERAWELRFFAV